MSIFKKDIQYNTTKEKNIIKRLLGHKLIKELKKSNAVLAGGAITSIFSKTPLNDFDIYFNNQNDFDRVTHFIKHFKAQNDIHYEKITKSFESEKAVLYDISINNDISVNKTLESYGISYNLNINSNNIIIQLIKPSIFKAEKDLLQKFDFSICMGRFDFKSEDFTFDPRFMIDLARKELTYNTECSNPIGSFFRLKKYLDKGFSIDPSEMLKIFISLNSINFNNYADFDSILDQVPHVFLRSHIQETIKDSNMNNKEYNHDDMQEIVEDFIINGHIESKLIQNRRNSKIGIDFLLS